MTTTAIIPARYASTRFPGKPLAKETGKYLIQHVCERVALCAKIDRVMVATDDERIAAAVKSFGGEVRMTRGDHASGTDRVGEVAAALDLADDDLVLNIQGDEPEISPAALERLIDTIVCAAPPCRIGTLAAPFPDDAPRVGPGSPLDPNCVKVVVDAEGRALYFSRSLVPYPRETGGAVDRPSRWLQHLGVYAFRADVLLAITGEAVGRVPPDTGWDGRAKLDVRSGEPRASALADSARAKAGGSLDVPYKAESLEQLRWLEDGRSIIVVRVDHAPVGIDTPQDYAAFVKRERCVTRRG